MERNVGSVGNITDLGEPEAGDDERVQSGALDVGAGSGQVISQHLGHRRPDQCSMIGEFVDGAGDDQPAVVDHDDVVDKMLHLREEVTRDEHGVAACGAGAE